MYTHTVQDCVNLWDCSISEGLWTRLSHMPTADAQVIRSESSFKAASECPLSLGDLMFPMVTVCKVQSQSVCGGGIITGWLCWRLGKR